jgi:SAM-dependent methyltransferase
VTQRTDLETIYRNRFARTEVRRNRVWQVLTRHFFQKWVRETDVVVDLGAGYCEFINNIRGGHKYAIDLNPATRHKASEDVTVLSEDVSRPWSLTSESVHVVFTSNFFEHLPSKQALTHCLSEIYRVLHSGGFLIALGPNIRYCYDVYWDFFDHSLPLSDRSMREAMEAAGFRVEFIIPRFLPFTMQGKLPSWNVLVRLYLLAPSAWRMFGKQFLIVVRKP